MLRSLLLLLSLLVALGSPAAAQAPGVEQEALLTPAERRAIQEALVWAGHYDARVDGIIGPATRSAIRDFQAAEGFRATGYLRQPHLDRLLEIRRNLTERFGWEIRRLPELGMQIGIPSALFRPPEELEHGIRFRSKEDQPRSELRLYSTGPMSDARFGALREELIDRDHFHRDTYDTGDEDWFVFSGTSEAGVEQYTYLVNREHGVRGFSFRYLERHADELSRLNVAMYNSLETFPAAGQQPAPGTAERERRPAPAGEAPPLFTERELAVLEGEPAEAPAPGRESAGFLVNPEGAVLTTASAIDGCERLRVNRRTDATITAVNRNFDLAVLSVPTGGRELPHLSFRGPPLEKGERLRALIYPPDGKLNVVPGKVEALKVGKGDIRRFRVDAELRRGNRGAPLVDAAGRVAGLAVGQPATAERADDQLLPAGQRLATRSDILEAFLGAHGVDHEVSAGEAEPQQEITSEIGMATVRIECVR